MNKFEKRRLDQAPLNADRERLENSFRGGDACLRLSAREQSRFQYRSW